jgi:MoxR-like ATPase
MIGRTDEEMLASFEESCRRLREEIARVIIGQETVVEELLTALFVGGHCLLVGVPGLAKTLLVSTVARSLNLTFSRIQFTPDLMPSDITGTEVLEEDPAPEAQLDRFMFNIKVEYPSDTEEVAIIDTTTSRELASPAQVLTGAEIVATQALVKSVPVSESVLRYAVRLIRASRDGSLPQIGKYLSWGAGPRAGQYLILGAKARAIMSGRTTPSVEDVRAVAPPVLRHRLVTNFHAEADGVTTDELVARLLDAVAP